MSEYYALRSLGAPGTLSYGYHRGDVVEAPVVENWGLVLDEDVSTEQPGTDAPAVRTGERPGPEATRADWEAYAIANGMDADRAREVSQDELEDVQQADAERVDSDRPSDSAKKADWIAYVVANGGDETWANASDTTKADLQGWMNQGGSLPAPDEGDPVAVDANNRANG